MAKLLAVCLQRETPVPKKKKKKKKCFRVGLDPDKFKVF
jgi:hypothetical protein